ncbi:MAG: hybrid sensor histidine kinase/response regulator [Leptolyngbyaceae cyanobacterium bins.349]|nr:hybrid sensor histidine kinase/response regulator [Leptolyngbyaceae cyanobacterium bins.349]
MNSHQQHTILIIDDASHDREMYRRYLKSDRAHTYLILEEETAEAGLAICRSHAVDGILLDFLLPDANGLEFLEALKAQHLDDCPPVIMITGQGSEAIAANAIKSGAEDYLIKRQITPENLQVTIQNAINHAQLRRQLQQSEARFQTSVENMLDCFGIFSAIRAESGEIVDFRADYLNAAALQDRQATLGDLSKGLHDLFPAHHHNDSLTDCCRVVETGQPLTKEAVICQQPGADSAIARVYDVRVSKLGDGFVASWRDVTARQQAERSRQQHMERERIIYQIAQQIRRSLNLEEILQTTVTEVRQFLNCDRVFIYQFQPDGAGRVAVEAIINSHLSILPKQHDLSCGGSEPRSQPLAQIRVISDIESLPATDAQVQVLKQLQVRANLEVPIWQGEGLWGLLIANQCDIPRHWDELDVELLHHLATQVGIAIDQADLLAQAEAARLVAEAANRAKDELLAMVSHELRSPLTTVLGWAKVLQTCTLEPTLVQQALQTIERSTQTQSQLIEDLLDVSRMIHGTLRLDRTAVDLVSVIETTIANLRLIAEAKAIVLESYILDAPVIVLGDSQRLQQVVTNLLTNAIKFTAEGGRVEVQLEIVKTQSTEGPEQSKAQITVTDTGRGIAPDLLPHIFKRFFQANHATSPRKEGLGLGLAIVHRLVELHHGAIVASSPGENQGATFTVHLPLLNH